MRKFGRIVDNSIKDEGRRMKDEKEKGFGGSKVRRFGCVERGQIAYLPARSTGIQLRKSTAPGPLSRSGLAGAQYGPPLLLPALRFWRQKRSTEFDKAWGSIGFRGVEHRKSGKIAVSPVAPSGDTCAAVDMTGQAIYIVELEAIPTPFLCSPCSWQVVVPQQMP